MVVDVSASDELVIKQHDYFVLCPANHGATKCEGNILPQLAVHVHDAMANFKVS